MRLAAAVLAAVLAAGCATAPPAPAPPRETARPLRLFALRGHEVRLAHAQSGPPGQTVASSGRRPRPLPLPPVLSLQNQRAMDEAEELYLKQQYRRALELAEPVYRQEPQNAFAVEAFARYLYRLKERARAYDVYRELVGLLDGQWEAAGRSVVVDLWFVDAYWKLGTLHVDRGEWQRAAFEISRAMVGGGAWERLATDQALAYLTRAYFELGDQAIARYYAERALERNPDNEVARHYLERLPAGGKER